MELNIPPLSILFSFMTFIFFIAKHLKNTKKSATSSPKLPPGPWELPLVGCIHHLIGPFPHKTLTHLARKYGPLMHLKLGEVSTIIISSPDIAKQALTNQDLIFSHRPYLLAFKILSYNSTNIAFSPYSNYWRQMRKICVMELLSTKRVQSFKRIREEEIFNFLKLVSKENGSPMNLSKMIYSLTYGIVSRAAFGNKSKDQEEFIKLAEAALALASGFTLADMYPSVKMFQVVSGMRKKLEKMQKRADFILGNILREHREKYRNEDFDKKTDEDLVDVLLRIQKQGDFGSPLSDDNIKAVILDIFSAGSDSSSTAVEWAMAEMLKNPQIMEKAQAEVRQIFNKNGNVDETNIDQLKYLNSIIKETLRLHPPGPLLVPRETSEQCEINGFSIPAKSKIIINAWALARDPDYWTEPDKFYPERFLDREIDFRGRNFEFIPFGAGRRICPGISFGIMNVQLPLANLLFHFDWKLANGIKHEELDMDELFGMTVKRANNLILVPISRKQG